MSSTRRWWLAVPAAAFAALLLATPAVASTVEVQDDAQVLDATAVQNEAATLPVGILIWTSTQDSANKSTFDNDVRLKVSSQFPIVLGINTVSHHATVQMSKSAGLSQSAAITAEQGADSAFSSTMRSQGNYTSAVNAAVTSLNGSLGGRHASGGTTTSGGSSISPIVVIVIIVVALIIVGLVVRRIFGGGRPRMAAPRPVGFQPGYGPQPYGPPPGYGPVYREGMSPGAAGALGAVGGGLLGYELGKMEGEREEYREDRYDNQNYGDQNYGGGDGGNWVVGQDTDFGGGGGDSNSGGGGGDW